MAVLYFFAKLIQVIIGVEIYAMMIRMLLPFFTDPEESRLYYFLFVITEPIITPVRFIFAKFNIGQESMFDWAFTATYLILIMLDYGLPVI